MLFLENMNLHFAYALITYILFADEETKSSTPTPQSTNWHNCNKMIFVPRSAQRGYSIGHWPIPEAYWPDTTDTLDVGVIVKCINVAKLQTALSKSYSNIILELA